MEGSKEKNHAITIVKRRQVVYFVYLDESGSTGPDPIQRFFVIAALTADAEHCIQAQEQLVNLKLKFFPTIQPEEIEIKGRNLVQGKDFFENVRLETRQAILEEIYILLRTQPFWLFATVVDKFDPALRRLSLMPDDFYRFAYKNLIRRIDLFLKTEAEAGLVFVDSRASSIRSHLQDARLISIHREYLHSVRKAGDDSRLVEYPVFVQSQFFAAIQLADVCAYKLFHAFQTTPDAKTTKELNPEGEEGLRIILKMLERSSGLERLP